MPKQSANKPPGASISVYRVTTAERYLLQGGSERDYE